MATSATLALRECKIFSGNPLRAVTNPPPVVNYQVQNTTLLS
ncbi:MAG: hypothetical protein QM715_05720 [Nibricoccus sp.]